ncbi:geranylgeranyl reductase family protein [Leptothrix sp. BB-4]
MTAPDRPPTMPVAGLPDAVAARLGHDATLRVDGGGDWPASVDVLVVGAGPAGSACAIELARAGRSVLLVDQHDFPRDKVCGEGLIPDAHAALAHLGVLDAVMARAQGVAHVRCVAPRGGQVDVPGRLAVLPRQVLDTLLVQQAQRCGARVRTPWKFDGLIESDGRVRGARLRSPGSAGETREVATRWVVMATGAAVPALIKADLCERRTPTGVALRVHVHAPDLAQRLTTMDVVWHRALRPGYGWIFPCGDGLFNIGVGAFFQRGESGDGTNLHELFDAFVRVHPPARELMQQARWRGDTKGAPLRCTLRGARLGRPGVLATGEAIGSTYDFSGEGIGKAMETGMLAAACIRDDGTDAQADADVLGRYQAAVAALQPRFDLYEKANQVNHHPWLADLVIWRARRSAAVLRRMSGVLEETSNPGNLLSLKGLARLFTLR